MYIDTHCHLFHEKHVSAIDKLVESAKEWQISKMITIGTSVRENPRAIEIAEKYEGVFCGIGVYPHDDMDQDIESALHTLDLQIKSSKKVVAVGECGIDISEWHGGRPLQEQVTLFEKQINMALNNSLPLIVHNRKGDDVILDMLKKYTPKGLSGVIHCFSSDLSFAKQVTELGFYISFAGNITYPSNSELRRIVENIPMEKILLETDSPYLPPQGYRGQVNEPKYVKIVAEKVAETKKMPVEEVAKITSQNAGDLFHI